MLFSKEYFQEIAVTLRRNKLRTFLTGFSVAWGVLFLILLLGVGTGIRSGVHKNSEANGETNDYIEFGFGVTSKPYKGLPQHRLIALTESEWQKVGEAIPQIENILMEFFSYTSAQSPEGRSGNTSLYGVTMLYLQKLNKPIILHGRALNESDMRHTAKHIVIAEGLARKLYGKENVVGQRISVGNYSFTIVGVQKSNNANESQIPESTFKRLFPYTSVRSTMAFIYAPEVQNNQHLKQLEQAIFAKVRLMKDIHPEDRCYWIDSAKQNKESQRKVFRGLDMFLWAMGLSTLMVGIVGVANIMLVTVRERMREIGIRKAIGAKNGHIITMIITESVVVTLISGLVGLIIAVGSLAGVERFLQMSGLGVKTIESQTFTIFGDPVIPPYVAIMVVMVMVVSGAIAGFVPARKAVRIPAIQAMKE